MKDWPMRMICYCIGYFQTKFLISYSSNKPHIQFLFVPTVLYTANCDMLLILYNGVVVSTAMHTTVF